jgi:deoxyribodipyrimidine photolyase-related protein
MTALLLYPNQLFAVGLLPRVDRVYLVEEPLFFGTDTKYPMAFHKQKLVLHRASMRRYAEEILWPNGYEVEYIECAGEVVTDTALVKAAFDGASEIIIFDPIDDLLRRRLESASKALEVHVPLKIIANPNFYLGNSDVQKFFTAKDKHKFADFYQWQRERHNILIDDNYRPFGGKWSFDSENRKRLSKDVQVPGLRSYGDNKHVAEAVQYVEAKFPHNPGSLNAFIWPTNHEEARAWLLNFFEERLRSFGPYEDAIQPGAVFLFHSALTPMLNTGLLNAREVIEEVLAYSATTRREVPLQSLEGFIRQILGWREYVRGMYEVHGRKQRTKNYFKHNRLLTSHWWNGTTGITPLDDVIVKTQNHAYAHHIERLMIAGNLMLLCNIDPDETYKWFMSLFIDSYDWVMVPNVYGMSQYADGGMMTTKPYIGASNYILQMSSYSRGPWCDIWDGLFWRFVDEHRMMLSKNPRLGGLLIKRYDSMDKARKRIIGYRAQDFLDTMTIQGK